MGTLTVAIPLQTVFLPHQPSTVDMNPHGGVALGVLPHSMIGRWWAQTRADMNGHVTPRGQRFTDSPLSLGPAFPLPFLQYSLSCAKGML